MFKLKYKYLFLLLLIASISISNANEALKLYIFLSEECPISRYHTKDIKMLAGSKLYDNIEVVCVFPMKSSTKEKVDKFKSDFNIRYNCILDSSQDLTKKYSVTTTPEVVLLSNDKIVYQGAIDDTYLSLGMKRKNSKNQYLIKAIFSAMSNIEIEIPKTKPVGCLITIY